jgi:hypothetical protein
MFMKLQSLLALLFVNIGLAADEQNLVQYGSFQTWNGTLQNWGGTYGRPNVILNDADGDNGLVMLIDQTPMSQTIPTIAGGNYELSFASRAPQPAEFSGPTAPNGAPIGPWQVNVYINYSRAEVFENDSQTAWQFFTMDFVATGPTTLGFAATQNAGWSLFDDVSVEAIPEPSVFSFVGLVLVIVAAKRSWPNTALEPTPTAL